MTGQATRPEWHSPQPGWIGVRGLRTQSEVDQAFDHLAERSEDFIGRTYFDLTPTGPIELCNVSGRRHAAYYLGKHLRKCLDLVIVSGGPEPLHPEWVRDIRDACQAAGVAFALRSWGDWADPTFADVSAGGPWCWLREDGTRQKTGPFHPSDCLLHRVGPARSGDLLDGVRWPVPEGF